MDSDSDLNATKTNTSVSRYLPGNTLLPAEEKIQCTMNSLQTADKPSIILASNDVNDDSLFLNGLTQNILILYQLFEAIGFKCYLLQNSQSTTNRKAFLSTYRYVNTHTIIHQNMSIKVFIEIGMSIDPVTRGYLRTTGCKIVKLYLGNILNIDIETIQHYPSMFFNHHLVGEIDEIWTSPHYYMHMDYASVINRIPMNKGLVVPYVWDPCFITKYGSRDTFEWIPPASWTTMDIVIMDPNISFQKCTFYSLLLAEAFARKHPEWKGKVQIINGDRLKISGNTNNKFLPALTLYQTNRVVLHGRKKIHAILEDHASSCFITHQWNNDYNYMALELFYCNYPLLHNSEGWDQFGYYYSINRWDAAIDTLHRALKDHQENLNIYKTHAANLIWKHSVNNPAIQERWRLLV